MDPSEGDFCQIVDKARQLLDIWLSDDQISNMSVYELKNFSQEKGERTSIPKAYIDKGDKDKDGQYLIHQLLPNRTIH